MATGTVKWFNPTKGFGFIAPDQGGNDVFVHISAVERAGISNLNEGQRVSYELATEKGKTSASAKSNGSLDHIAGICNEKRNVFGLMPHPEQAAEKLLGGEDGLRIFASVAATCGKGERRKWLA